MLKTLFASAVAVGLALTTVPATAQQSGLVNVTVSNVDILRNSLNKNDVDVLNNLINDNQIAILNGTQLAVPVVLQVPIGIAANVCGTTVAVLAAAASPAACNAENSSRALGNIINRQFLSDFSAANR